ncbi:MAG: T9SS type A sorting domain-containing protein [Bacteroidota bacterium]
MIKKALLLLSFVCIQQFSFGQAGAFDLTFANAGIGTYMPGTLQDVGYSITGLPDSSIYALSAAKINNISSSVVMHFNEDGTVDSSFGTNGKALIQVGTSTYMYGMALQSDGKIVAVGLTYTTVSDGNFLTCRINTDGSIDTTFGNNGYAIQSFGTGEDGAKAVKILSDGSILVAGYANSGTKKCAFVKYDTDGNLITSFGLSGTSVITIAGSTSDQINSIDVLSDGSIVGVGYKTAGSTGTFVTVAIQLTNFGNQLNIWSPVVGGSSSQGSVVIADGMEFYIGGYNSSSSATNMYLTKLNTTGAIPATFNGGVTSYLNSGAVNYLLGAVRQPDGKIVICGASGAQAFTRGWLIARFNSNGALDATFGTNGKVSYSFGSGVFADANAVCLFTNGKIGVTGFRSSTGGSANDLIIIRLLNDTSFCIIPSTPSSVTGQQYNVCGKTLTYTIPAVANADNYTWRASNPNVLINGAPGPFTDTVLTVTITWPVTLTSNTTLFVKANNACGSSIEKTFVAIVLPANINSISGSNLNVFGQTTNYSIGSSVGATTYTWTTNVNGAQINGIQGMNYTTTDTSISVTWPTQFTNGILYVQASNDCGSSPVYTINLLGTVGLNELKSSAIIVYPNPTNENSVITIQAELNGKTNLQLMDLSGKLAINTVIEFKNNEAALNLEGLTKGTYLIKLINDEKSITKKITIQ